MALHVSDVERSCRFYSETLKLERIPRPDFDFPGAWFRLGSTQELHLIGNLQTDVHSHHRGNHFALLTSDLAAWEEHLSTIGAERSPRRTRPDGAYQIFVTDPDGHVIELCSAPPSGTMTSA